VKTKRGRRVQGAPKRPASSLRIRVRRPKGNGKDPIQHGKTSEELSYIEKSDKPSAAVGKWRGKRRKGTLTEERTVAELNKTQAPIARAQ
jgi:hypothetical protein